MEGSRKQRGSCNTPLRVLFLTSSLGGGHERAAQAAGIALQLRNKNIRLSYIDFWDLMDFNMAGIIKNIYLHLVEKNPSFYDHIHRFDHIRLKEQITRGTILKPISHIIKDLSIHSFPRAQNSDWWQYLLDRFFFQLILSSLNKNGNNNAYRIFRLNLLKCLILLLSERLKFKILKFSPDIVLATQWMPAALLSFLKQRDKLNYIIISVLTDYGLNNLWIQPGIDHYCIPTKELAQALSSQGIADSRIHYTGIPLMPGFSNMTTDIQARLDLGLDPNLQTILISGGSLGIGITEILNDLLPPDNSWQILVATGSKDVNPEGYYRHHQGDRCECIRIYGWIERMDVMIRAADVVVTKPGGLAIAESLACGKPLLAPFSLGGQETFNLQFLIKHSVGGLVEKGRLTKDLSELLSNPAKLMEMQNRSWNLGCRDSAARVANLVEHIAIDQRRLNAILPIKR